MNLNREKFKVNRKNNELLSIPRDGRTLRLRLHETRSVWNRYKIGTDKPYVYTGPGRYATDRFTYPVPNGFTCESDPV